MPDLNELIDTNEPYLDVRSRFVLLFAAIALTCQFLYHRPQWLEFLLSRPKIPQTISTSYGDEEQFVVLALQSHSRQLIP